MYFDTPVYIVFLVAVVILYWRLRWRPQNVMLLAASYFFYGWWDYRFLALIFLSTFVDYHCARLISDTQRPRKRQALLVLSLAVNLSFLGWFKYFGFFVDSMAHALEAAGVHGVHVATLKILLPPGISFYTFQEVAYIVDVYRKKLPASKSFVDYALFISLFPHLIAGPIQQPSHLLPQVQRPRLFDMTRFFDGVVLIVTGLFRKCVIADNCALIANAAFGGSLGEPSLAVLVLGSYAFAFQIYGDFSGYSDIARGSAQLLGFHFMVNFRQPYLAGSVQDFWRRWHISLTNWLRDYLFLPVSFWLSRRLDGVRWLGISDDVWIYASATFATMLLGGLWHGANWTFVLWGALFGLALAVERTGWTVFGPKGRRNPLRRLGLPLTSPSAWLQRLFVFHIVCLSWVFFRAATVSDALTLFGGSTRLTWQPHFGVAARFLALFVIPMLLLDIVNERRSEEYLFERASLKLRSVAAFAVAVVALLFSGNNVNAFIYFQF